MRFMVVDKGDVDALSPTADLLGPMQLSGFMPTESELREWVSRSWSARADSPLPVLLDLVRSGGWEVYRVA